jgi:hypothetical protein
MPNETNLMDAFYATPMTAVAAPVIATKLRYSQLRGSYNARRYGRPWIGVITSWPVGGRPEIAWGGYVGDDSGGEVEIMAFPGSIIRSGQKDNRGNGTDNDWWEAMADGSMRPIDQPEARKLWMARSGK